MNDPIPRWKPPRLAVKRTSEQAHYHSREWRAKRVAILLRDAYRCSDCGLVVSGQDAHVDHRIPLEEGGSDHADNLQTLCISCHGRKTAGEQRRRGLR